MRFKIKNFLATGIVISGVFLLSPSASAQTATSFYVDSGFDDSDREIITATVMHEGEHARFYVEDAYWSSISSSARTHRSQDIADLAKDFDAQIYPAVTEVFGTEWTPGIDNDPKITILITNMQDDVGGYFREDDERADRGERHSNEREMLYLNSDFLKDSRHIRAFLAHELQHLIHYNQRNRQRGVREEVWVNEMMSEVAPTIAGLNDSWRGSNLQSRTRIFLESPSDEITRWGNSKEDYGVISMFGHYILDHYGIGFFKALSRSELRGIDAVNDALQKAGATERFEDVFNNWVISSLINNCVIEPADTFCYLNPNLDYSNLHISFSTGSGEAQKKIEQANTTYPWQGNWHSYSRASDGTQPEDHIFALTFNKPQGTAFSVPYVAYPRSGQPEVYYMALDGNRGKFYLEDFGNVYSEVVLMPVLQDFSAEPLVEYNITAEVTTDVPTDATDSTVASKEAPASLPDGALVRASGDSKVYIIKETPEGNKYKRWIQSGDIINMYGHLRWEDIMTVSAGALENYKEVHLIRYADDPRVYSVSFNGHKRWIETADEFFGLGYAFDMVYEVNEEEFNFYLEL